MNNSWFDKSFDGFNNDFFDDVIKYLDFPLEDVEGTDGGGSGEGVIKDFNLPLDDVEENNGGGGGEEWDCNFQNLEPPPANVLAGLSSGFYGDFFSDSLAKNLTVSDALDRASAKAGYLVWQRAIIENGSRDWDNNQMLYFSKTKRLHCFLCCRYNKNMEHIMCTLAPHAVTLWYSCWSKQAQLVLGLPCH